MAQITIKDRTEVLAADPARMGKLDIWLTYATEDGRQDLIIIPKELATEAEIIKRVREKEAARTQIVGKTLTI